VIKDEELASILSGILSKINSRSILRGAAAFEEMVVQTFPVIHQFCKNSNRQKAKGA